MQKGINLNIIIMLISLYLDVNQYKISILKNFHSIAEKVITMIHVVLVYETNR